MPEQRDKAARAVAAAPEVKISLVWSGGDPAFLSSDFLSGPQAELQRVRDALHDEGIEAHGPVRVVMDSPAAGGDWVGDFIIHVVQMQRRPLQRSLVPGCTEGLVAFG